MRSRLNRTLTLAGMLAIVLGMAASLAPPAFSSPGLSNCSRCNCRHFEGATRTCGNSGCGHSYSSHY